MLIRSAVRAAALSCLFAAATAPALAQCQLEWLPGAPHHGTSGNPYDEHIWSMHHWDPDGAGPLPMRLVFGGSFPSIGPITANRIASWDPASGEWAAFGSGINSPPRSFATAANGDLIIGHNGVSRWNGSNWSQVGLFFSGSVEDLAVLANGDIVAVGTFGAIGGSGINRIARWNGSTWSPLGTGTTSTVHSVLELPNGDLVVSGEFTSIGGVAANLIARWDGTAWHALGGGLTSAFPPSVLSAYDLALRPNGDLVVVGSFTFADGIAANGVAGWDGTSWYGFGGGLNYPASCVHVEANGDLLVNASASFGAANCSRWDGTSWQPATQPIAGYGLVTTLPGGDIIRAGEFTVTDANGTTLHDVARWNGTAWVELTSATTPWFTSSLGALEAVAATSDGTIYATGLFQIVDGALLNGIARFNGSGWDPVGSPLGIGSWPFPYPYPFAMIATANDDIVVGGRITGIVGGPAGHVVRWNGTSWDNLGGGIGAEGSVWALAELPNGDLVVGGDFVLSNGAPGNRVARWDGVAWHPMGAGATGIVHDLLTLPDGDVVATGPFLIGPTPHNIARWNGSTWSALGAGTSQYTFKPQLMPNGDIVALVAAPQPFLGGSVMRWDGATWTQVGAAFTQVNLYDLVVLPDGDLLVTGGSSSFGTQTRRWDGVSWTEAPSTDTSFGQHTWLPDGDLLVAGGFKAAGPWLSPGIARLRSSCAAAATVTGAGCASSGGANQLAAATLPWLGSTFRAEGSGLPTLALVSQVWGFTPMNLPLSALLPQAPPGCDLLVTPDYVEFALTTDGTVATSVTLPSNPALVGVQLHHQLNLFEVTPTLDLVEVTASNALLLTTGAF
ncbi:MAG: hypothetical protein R3F29_01390 [Planctomycetota bacterium]